jgi:hypothetical protein
MDWQWNDEAKYRAFGRPPDRASEASGRPLLSRSQPTEKSLSGGFLKGNHCNSHTPNGFAPTAPTDSNGDGMPDAWGLIRGLNPFVQDHNGTQLSLQ